MHFVQHLPNNHLIFESLHSHKHCSNLLPTSCFDRLKGVPQHAAYVTLIQFHYEPVAYMPNYWLPPKVVLRTSVYNDDP